MVLEDYQTSTLEELFEIEILRDSLEQTRHRLTPQQEAILDFIIDHPNEQFIEMQKTFKMPDYLIVDLVIEYGTSTEKMEEMRQLKEKLRDS